jgi:hypothetical protein
VAFSRNDNRTKQPGIGLRFFRDVGMVPPDYRRQLTRPRTAALIREPVISKSSAGRNMGTGSADGQVISTLIVLVIPKPVRMNVMFRLAAIEKVDQNRVANFGTDDRT